VSALVSASPCHWWTAFIRIAVATGLRVNEILRLHESDVHERTRSLRITSDPIPTTGSEQTVSLRRWMPTHRERVLPLASDVMASILCLRAERPTDEYVFVPDWKLDQLWLRANGGEPLSIDLLSPGLAAWFLMIQRRARLLLARDEGLPMSEVRWIPRGIQALRTTAICRLAEQLQPRELAEHLGYSSVRSVRRFYDVIAAGSTGVNHE
jgi:integrase